MHPQPWCCRSIRLLITITHRLLWFANKVCRSVCPLSKTWIKFESLAACSRLCSRRCSKATESWIQMFWVASEVLLRNWQLCEDFSPARYSLWPAPLYYNGWIIRVNWSASVATEHPWNWVFGWFPFIPSLWPNAASLRTQFYFQ